MSKNGIAREIIGRVVANHGGTVKLSLPNGEINIVPPRGQHWVVGDLVKVAGTKPKNLLPRKNLLEREGSRKGREQPLASNLDCLVIVTSSGLAFKPGLIDRFMVAAAYASIPFILVFNKIDLDYPTEQLNELGEYEKLGLDVHKVSAKTCQGIDSLAKRLSGSISAMIGHSGVGKTSLLNHLCPNISKQVGAVHTETERGRHTTTSALLVNLPSGGGIIDSPGLRMFNPVGLDQIDAARFFPGFANLWAKCKFRNCRHNTEPGCEVKAAINRGDISESRYQSYIRLCKSLEKGY